MFQQIPFELLANIGRKSLRVLAGCFTALLIVAIVVIVSCSAIVGFNIGSASDSSSRREVSPSPTPQPTVAISTFTPIPRQTVGFASVVRLEGIGESTGFLDIESGIYDVRLTVVGNDRRFAPDTYEFTIGVNAAEFVLKGRDDAAMDSGRYTVHTAGERAWAVKVGDDARWTVTFEPVDAE